MKAFIRSFYYALNGLRICFLSETNMRVHVLAAGMAVFLGWYFRISELQWIIVLACIAFVWFAELINTAIELLCNVVSPGHHPVIGKVKDLAAGAVLVSAILSASIGLIIFLPHFLHFFSNK